MSAPEPLGVSTGLLPTYAWGLAAVQPAESTRHAERDPVMDVPRIP